MKKKEGKYKDEEQSVVPQNGKKVLRQHIHIWNIAKELALRNMGSITFIAM
jgi:hypothetical protein